MSRTETYRRDCRITGLLYLGLAIAGGLAFMMVRRELFIEADPAGTLARLAEKESLARIGIALELGTATLQALAAVWFGKLFRDVDAFAANALTLFGMVNAIVVLASAALMGGALDVALLPDRIDPGSSYLLFLSSGHFWKVGNIFFGLWLVPMGWLTLKSGIGHRSLGWILMAGGVGYVINAFVAVLVRETGAWVGFLPILATIGEFWMIGLLFWIGLRSPRS